ncbi:MAG: magnesium transporter [Clostridiales bacterium]|nr:magnesium transporter [Clostridiales bacterium]
MKEDRNFEELFSLFKERKFAEFKENLIKLNEVDAASFICETDEENRLLIFRMLPKDISADVFSNLPIEVQHFIIKSISDKEVTLIIEDLFVDDAVDMLEELPATVVKRVLRVAQPDTREVINKFLKYPENSAGSVMTAEYIALKKHMTVEQAIAYIRKNGVDKETIYTCYVTNDTRVLEGVVSFRELIMNSYETSLEDIMDTNVIKAVTTDDREDIAAAFNKYDLIAMPVVDKENRLVGIITVDDAVDVMEQEATEDFEKMAAMLPSEKPYLKTSVFKLSANRIPWLLVLMISSMLTGGILAAYEEAFAVMPLLVTFMPMLTDTGGNAGSQSSTMIIRGMAVGEIKGSDFLKVFWKELRVALICGTALAAVNFIRLQITNPGNIMAVVTVVVSLYVTVILAKTIGGLLPMAAKAIGLDPALMAAPLITTVVDAVSLIIYFRFAVMILHI